MGSTIGGPVGAPVNPGSRCSEGEDGNEIGPPVPIDGEGGIAWRLAKELRILASGLGGADPPMAGRANPEAAEEDIGDALTPLRLGDGGID